MNIYVLVFISFQFLPNSGDVGLVSWNGGEYSSLEKCISVGKFADNVEMNPLLKWSCFELSKPQRL